jgi:hypothetical protein
MTTAAPSIALATIKPAFTDADGSPSPGSAELDAGVRLRDMQEAASHADPRTTMRYDRARGSLDRRATCSGVAYVAGAVR